MHSEMVATYRLQLHANFTFHAAAAVLPYLSALGVSHVYLSPVLEAGPGSTHGYDVADVTRVSAVLGGADGLAELFGQLRRFGMAAVIDIVPNHMATVATNHWWWDVLEHGQTSVHAPVFDIDWSPPDPELYGKVLLPVLGDHLGAVLARGELGVVAEGESVQVEYFAQRFPVNAAGRALVAENPRLGEHPEALADLLDAQFYRLANWRTAAEEINYRRFFDITSLISVRVEQPDVFEAVHATLVELVAGGPVDALRIDHPDGLSDPRGYFERLREVLPATRLLVEKILAPGERLRGDWPVDGTTGYDFLQRAGGLFVDPEGEKSISDFYADFTGHSEPLAAVVREKKRAVLETSFDGDVRRLVEALHAVCRQADVRLDYSRRQLRQVLVEVVASFPVYRTYAVAGTAVAAEDREAIGQALASARRRSAPLDAGILDFLEVILCGECPPGLTAAEFVARFQQLCSPVMAKGVEDTTFYTYDRLLALNEVGCDPARFGISPAAFHEESTHAQRDWPHGLNCLSTHDTKRSGDVRARIALLSEMPDAWGEEVRRWAAHNAPAWHGREPDRSAEHLLYQTLVGAWPIAAERLAAYMQKACREAKTFTSWTDPDPDYERRIAEFVAGVLGDEGFVQMLGGFVAPLVAPGRVNSLAQTLLKLTAPGVPDTYQGCELWDNSLVDPDNRRPVDYPHRARLLGELPKMDVGAVMARAEEGLPKLHLVHKALALRRRRPAAFGAGEAGGYAPLTVAGGRLRHVVGFRRGECVAVVVPRLVLRLAGDWQDTTVELGAGSWLNVLDGTRHTDGVALADLLGRFPVALLEREVEP